MPGETKQITIAYTGGRGERAKAGAVGLRGTPKLMRGGVVTPSGEPEP